MAPRPTCVVARVMRRLPEYLEPDSCWEWPGAQNGSGYGRIHDNSRDRGVHRVMYEARHGGIPDGLEVDHLCRNRACCNPAHLEAVSHKENVIRGGSFSAINARVTHCPAGHAYDEQNTRHERRGRGGWNRKCCACKRARDRRYKARKKAIDAQGGRG